ncbi:MAG: cytochrome c biogenesis protein CcsA [Acidobacteriia bacterium]|nr:cytochrome c biogenesis protein CcsA [Terriglobia bacterium]
MFHKISNLLFFPLILLFPFSLYMVFVYAPEEATMGIIQKIFYYHVSAGWVFMLAFGLVLIGSIGYLVTQRRSWDSFAASSAELGVVFCTISLTTGPLWAKPVWGIWWTWDARLTSTLVEWLIYVAYLMLRAYVPEPTKRANLSAVFGILGALDVPIVYFSIRWWRTQHPAPVMGGGGYLDPQMRVAFFVCLATFTLLYFFLLGLRMKINEAEDEIGSLKRLAGSQA